MGLRAWGRALLAVALVGCGGGAGGGSAGSSAPASVVLAETCVVSGVRIEVEEGVLGGFGGESPCAYSGRFVASWRGVFEERWGAVALDGWSVRIRAGELLDGQGHAGLTWYRGRMVEVSQDHFELLPHEFRHVQLGEGSSDHHGWCSDFVLWEQERNIQDERARLGCPP